MHGRLNALKGREPWRPFGAAALSSRAGALWSPRPRLSDYMLAGTPVSDAGGESLPAAVHVDGTTRPQELDPASDDLLVALLHEWGERAGGALVNTSFNGPGEPIVSSRADAAARVPAPGPGLPRARRRAHRARRGLVAGGLT